MLGCGHILPPSTIHGALRPPSKLLLKLLQKLSPQNPIHPPKATSVCRLPHIHLLCLASHTGSKDRNVSPSHIPVQRSQPHAYAYIVVVRADQVSPWSGLWRDCLICV